MTVSPTATEASTPHSPAVAPSVGKHFVHFHCREQPSIMNGMLLIAGMFVSAPARFTR